MNPILFAQFAGLWVPLCLARDVAAGRPTPLVVAGEPIVLFRNDQGGIMALIDRCPHRGVALSLGKIECGAIVCPFHGWQFDGAGQCLTVPWNPDARLDRLSATPLPVREIGGLVWLFTGTCAVGEPMVPPVLLRDDVTIMAQNHDWTAHWTRVMENMLDSPHVPFVHAGTIGRSLRGRVREKMTMSWHETTYGADITAIRGDEAPRTTLHYHYPCTMELAIDPGGRTLRMFSACIPTGPGHTRLTIYTVRNFARSRLMNRIFARSSNRIAREDKAIVESQRPAAVPPATAEKSVASDAPTLAFRKLWFTRISLPPGTTATD